MASEICVAGQIFYAFEFFQWLLRMVKIKGDRGQPHSTPRLLGALPEAPKYIEKLSFFQWLLRMGKI
jgi:hypothetical protein